MESCTGHNGYLCFVEAIVRSSSRPCIVKAVVSLRRVALMVAPMVALRRGRIDLIVTGLASSREMSLRRGIELN